MFSADAGKPSRIIYVAHFEEVLGVVLFFPVDQRAPLDFLKSFCVVLCESDDIEKVQELAVRHPAL